MNFALKGIWGTQFAIDSVVIFSPGQKKVSCLFLGENFSLLLIFYWEVCNSELLLLFLSLDHPLLGKVNGTNSYYQLISFFKVITFLEGMPPHYSLHRQLFDCLFLKSSHSSRDSQVWSFECFLCLIDFWIKFLKLGRPQNKMINSYFFNIKLLNYFLIAHL